MSEKPCKQCREVKPLDGFYRDETCADRHMHECKACHRKNVYENRALKKAARAA